MENIQMNGAEIAREMGISRQAVSYVIRKSIRSMYKLVLEQKIADTPFKAVLALMEMLNVGKGDVDDIKQFLNLFDRGIIKQITEEAQESYNIRL